MGVTALAERQDRALNARVAAIVGAPAPERSELIGAFVSDFHEPLGRLAGRLCRTFKVEADEARSIVLGVVFDLLTGEECGQVENFMGFLSVVSRNEMVRYVDHRSNSGMTGLNGHQRRVRTLARAKVAFHVLYGHQPSDTELLEFHNAVMHTRRSSAARQGALACPDDLRPVRLDNVDSAAGRSAMSGPLTEAEGRELVRLTIERCTSIDPKLGSIAQTFLGGHLSNPGDIDTRVVALCQATRVPIKAIPDMMAQVRVVAAGVAQEMLGA